MTTPDISKKVDWIGNGTREQRPQVTIKRINKLLEEKGIDNVEVTKYKGKYHVLHILRNNVPVPLMITEDKKELLDYLNAEYNLEI